MTEEQSKYEIQKVQQEVMLSGGSIFLNVARFEFAQRVAKVFAASTMVPAQYRGNEGNCLIAMNLAERWGADPFMVMQNVYVIGGKPGIEGKLVVALINSSGRFEPVEFEASGTVTACKNDTDGMRAYAKEVKSGKVLYGPMVTWAMVKAEGWLGKDGSKWKTIPEVMFGYRAASFFARRYCPEVLLGMQTKEELIDAGSQEINLSRGSDGRFAMISAQEDGSVQDRLSATSGSEQEQNAAAAGEQQEPPQAPKRGKSEAKQRQERPSWTAEESARIDALIQAGEEGVEL